MIAFIRKLFAKPPIPDGLPPGYSLFRNPFNEHQIRHDDGSRWSADGSFEDARRKAWDIHSRLERYKKSSEFTPC